MRAAILDLRRRTREILRAVERGETVTIMFRGKAKAVISPLPGARGRAGSALDHPAFGMWRGRPAMKDVAGFVRKLREGRRRAV